MKTVSGELKDELDADYFDDVKVGAPNSGDALITRELDFWIIDNSGVARHDRASRSTSADCLGSRHRPVPGGRLGALWPIAGR